MKRISHGAILRRYKGRISGTFLILFVENILQVAEPFVLGLAVNALVAGTWGGVYAFLAVEVAMVVIGTLRRFYDTRSYGAIYREISEEIAHRSAANDDDLSPAIGRADLLLEVIDFFEHELPMGLTSIFSIGGALVMLLVLAPTVGLVCLLSAVLIGAVFLLSRNRMRRLNAMINDELEARARVFMDRKAEQISGHFNGLVRHRIHLSDLEARNFGLSYMFVVMMVAYALYQVVAVQQANMGDVFAVLTYASQFSGGVLVLPMMYQQFIRTEEITGRLNRAEGDATEVNPEGP